MTKPVNQLNENLMLTRKDYVLGRADYKILSNCISDKDITEFNNSAVFDLSTADAWKNSIKSLVYKTLTADTPQLEHMYHGYWYSLFFIYGQRYHKARQMYNDPRLDLLSEDFNNSSERAVLLEVNQVILKHTAVVSTCFADHGLTSQSTAIMFDVWKMFVDEKTVIDITDQMLFHLDSGYYEWYGKMTEQMLFAYARIDMFEYSYGEISNFLHAAVNKLYSAAMAIAKENQRDLILSVNKAKDQKTTTLKNSFAIIGAMSEYL